MGAKSILPPIQVGNTVLVPYWNQISWKVKSMMPERNHRDGIELVSMQVRGPISKSFQTKKGRNLKSIQVIQFGYCRSYPPSPLRKLLMVNISWILAKTSLVISG